MNILTYDGSEQADDYLSTMAVIMTPVFRKFFRSAFSTWTDTKATVMMMKMYMFIGDTYGTRLTSHQIVEIIRKLIGDTQCRGVIVNIMSEFIEGNGNFECLCKKLINEYAVGKLKNNDDTLMISFE
jgi:hypothetical protein